MTSQLLRRVRPVDSDSPFDLRIAGGHIVEAGQLTPEAGERVLDFDGRRITPGLVDHHVHVTQWATLSRRLDLSPAASPEETATLVRAALQSSRDEVLVGFGFRAALWADAPSVALLDAATGERPVALASADLHSVWLNSAALRRYGRPHTDGLLREHDAFAVLRELDNVPAGTSDHWVGEALRAAAARGVTRIVDFEMAWNAASWNRRAAGAPLSVRIDFGIYPDDLGRALSEGLTTGRVVDMDGRVRVGSLKIITDGSLGTHTALCEDPYPGTNDRGRQNVAAAELLELLTHAQRRRMTVAVHAIGDEANRLALDAFAISRARGSIEHAQLLRHADVRRFADLGVVASVQPEQAMDDRDAAEALWPARTGRAFPLRDLLDAGATLAFGSDAPVVPCDPWQAISAAVFRTRGRRPPWHPEQRITLTEALAASTDTRLRPGDPADLAILDGDPAAADAHALRSMPVAATMVGGDWSHSPSELS